ncbi:Cytochrome oxidase biogenesis protein Sco1/SenC/PrrC, putative copper metallochaperone [Enhygromyxa salina]|uniref:Cytochrome oxidase biogenesis protein Sco1/SenC/PrrC, putative copper metallochaperone n=1 Tax=Enhygromyxa salina TaxID=215803 RepID=A0A0C2CV81_9BACT|nr:SCO family protein [Enhygromyxa salina]KIG15016.1 Cytochrome oxidase biogenesis protein Sco1/SenC/PrrC, putative copper metallochaperone [Enhygromyxa salina]
MTSAPTPTTAQPWDQPAPWILFLRKHIWVIGILFFLTMITVMRPLLVRRPPPPEVVGEVPAFTLVDSSGEAFGRNELLAADKTWVVGFVFTRCPSTCPAISRAMLSFQEQISRSRLEEHVELLTITVDPEYDTPEVLAAYAASIGANLDNWRFVTGDKQAIEDFVVGGFKLAVGDAEQVADREPGVIDIAHSTKLALVDRYGNIRGYYSTDEDGLAELYHRTLRVIRLEEGE